MKLKINNFGFEGNLPEDRIDIKIESSAMMYDILSSGIYKDKILAVIREYICNAYDAHVSVGKCDTPFKVRLPSYLDSTFSVTDEGSGVDPKMIGKIFWTYDRSTKTDDEQTIGALGLGSKSAFAYTKSSFVVKNNYQGVEYTYFCFINEKGVPQGSKVGETPTDLHNGITVEFAVRPEDISAADRARKPGNRFRRPPAWPTPRSRRNLRSLPRPENHARAPRRRSVRRAAAAARHCPRFGHEAAPDRAR